MKHMMRRTPKIKEKSSFKRIITSNPITFTFYDSTSQHGYFISFYYQKSVSISLAQLILSCTIIYHLNNGTVLEIESLKILNKFF